MERATLEVVIAGLEERAQEAEERARGLEGDPNMAKVEQWYRGAATANQGAVHLLLFAASIRSPKPKGAGQEEWLLVKLLETVERLVDAEASGSGLAHIPDLVEAYRAWKVPKP